MTEKLLQFLWQFRHFQQQGLYLESGESLQVLFPGTPNNDQGPDFLNARIKIDRTVWVGHIELHLLGSDWARHAHDTDSNYNNVMLHVVWQNDKASTSREIPVLVLQNRVSKLLLPQYEEWMGNRQFIPCEKQLPGVPELVWTHWKQRLLVERMQRKTATVTSWLETGHYHWEEVFWWMIARNFGLKINAPAFEAMARTISVSLLARYKNRPFSIEALLLGQCGLLAETLPDDYSASLQKEYHFLRSKFNLRPINLPVHFLRMRPVNFPTIRLSQLADLIRRSAHLFSTIRDAQTISEIRGLLTVRAASYWNQHFTFGEISPATPKILGRQMINGLLINTIIPMVFIFGEVHREKKYIDKALEWLQQIGPEQNSVIKSWGKSGVEGNHAFDTQALLELKSQYCDHKKCLDCAIGNSILKRISGKT